MKDLVLGAASDSGLRLVMDCPRCGRAHHVALTRLDGRFAVRCRGRIVAGKVDDWQTLRARAAQMGGAHVVRPTDG